jgi:dipeptidyl aminopeptidase/acylaminoacyl peptidase
LPAIGEDPVIRPLHLLTSIALLVNLSLAMATASPPPGAAKAAPRAITLDDYDRVKSPDDPRLARDGRQIAYVVDGQIHVVPTSGGTPRVVTAAGSQASAPYWSRDGRTLYFLSDRSKSSQVWKLSVDSFGEASQVTALGRGFDTVNFSHDETQLLLTSTVTAATAAADTPPGKAAATEPWVITRLQFKEDAGDGYLTGDRAEHLFVYELATARLRQVTSGPYTEAQPAWSPDGRMIVFVSNREDEPDASYKTDLWLVAAHNTDQGRELVRLTNDDRVKSAPAWSPDGRVIAFLSAEDGVYGLPQLAVIPASGGPARILTAELDRWISSFKFSPDGQWIYLAYEHLGGTNLARVRLRDGKLEPVLQGEQQASSFDVSRASTLAAVIQHMNDAPELYSVARGRALRLTGINDAYLQTVVRASKEKVEFKSPDGTAVEAFVTKPPGYAAGRRYPTLLHVHGGPVGQFAYGFDFEAQYFAAHGYVVVQPNPRGSTGRGQEFVRGIYQTWGITDYDDVIAGVDHMIREGVADPDRLGVHGYSYGGYMTNVIVTRTPRFKAAASGAGHSLIVGNYGHDIYQQWYNWELGLPWENREKYDRLSPLLRAGQVQTPTLFLGGRDDWNVPVLSAELFYQSLRKRGIDTQLVVYPGMHHSDWTDEFQKDFLQRHLQWFDRYLGATPAQDDRAEPVTPGSMNSTP